MRGITAIHRLGPRGLPHSGQEGTSQAPFPSSPEGRFQSSLLCMAAVVMHEITSCTKGAVGMKNVDAAWFMHFHILILKACGLHKCLQSVYLCQGMHGGQHYLLIGSLKSAGNLYSAADGKDEPQ